MDDTTPKMPPAVAARSIAELCSAHGVPATEQDLQLIVAGASGRVVVRIAPGGQACGLLGVYWTANRADNNSFVPAAEGLARCGIRVPRIVRYQALAHGCGVCLVEDLGSLDLLSLKGLCFEQQLPAYSSALQLLADFHRVQPHWTLQPEFDAAMYRWEQGYFAEHLLGRHLGMNAADFSDRAAAVEVARFLEAQPRVPVHRDFQSQNIMLKEGQAWFIDFQGMRYGCAEYDVASLAFDPYMDLEPVHDDKLLAVYEQCIGRAVDTDVYYACALQRMMQALGAFANIGYNQQRQWYLSLIPTGLNKLRHIAARVTDGSPAHALATWLLNHV